MAKDKYSDKLAKAKDQAAKANASAKASAGNIVNDAGSSKDQPAPEQSGDIKVLAATDDAGNTSSGAKHAKEEPPVPDYLRKSRRVRRILIVVIILLVLLLGAGAFLGYQLLETAQNAATQQTQDNQISDVTSIGGDATAMDAPTATKKITTVPDLVSLLGTTEEEAVEILQHGAQVTSSIDVNEEGNPVKRDIRIALTAEPSDTRSGTPTVYMALNEEFKAIQVGYSVTTSSLGYGSLSFSDAIQNEHIVEQTLAEAGVEVPAGAVVLPTDKMLYSTYASDGTTLTRENCSFEGMGTAATTGQELPWTAILSYDYSTANATGNLVDTIRTIYVYVSAPAEEAAGGQSQS